MKKSGSRTSTPKGVRQFQMPGGGFRSPEGQGRGQMVRVLGIGDGYAGCRQTRPVEEERMRGCQNGGRLQQVRWVHGRGDKDVGRHQAHGRRENVRRTVRVHRMRRADTTRLDANVSARRKSIFC